MIVPALRHETPPSDAFWRERRATPRRRCLAKHNELCVTPYADKDSALFEPPRAHAPSTSALDLMNKESNVSREAPLCRLWCGEQE